MVPDASVSGTGCEAEPPAHPVDRAALLLSLATRITASLDLQEVLDASFQALRQLLDFDGGAIQLIEDDFLVAAATDPPMAPEARTVRIPVGAGVSGRIAATAEPIYIPDITVDTRVHPEGRAKGLSGGVRSYFGVPLILGGAPIGVLQVDSNAVDAFDDETRTLLLAFVPTITAAVQNAHLFDQEREALRQLEEVQRLKDGFMSIVSHELRTPMATALGFAETLVQHADHLSTDGIVDLAHRIHSAGGRLQRLLEDLMFAARLEQRFLDVEPRPTEVGAVARSVVHDDPDRAHPVLLDLPDTEVWAVADDERLHQVLTNLVDNAAKFSPDDQPVWIHLQQDDESVEVAVEDRGRGIPVEAREDIFRLFYQAEPFATRSAGGLGIGLYVVKRLCDAMAARVEVTQPPAGGTRIAVRLPRAKHP